MATITFSRTVSKMNGKDGDHLIEHSVMAEAFYLSEMEVDGRFRPTIVDEKGEILAYRKGQAKWKVLGYKPSRKNLNVEYFSNFRADTFATKEF